MENIVCFALVFCLSVFAQLQAEANVRKQLSPGAATPKKKHLAYTSTTKRELLKQDEECIGKACGDDKTACDIYPDCDCSSEYALARDNPLAERPECIPRDPESEPGEDECTTKPCSEDPTVCDGYSNCICSSLYDIPQSDSFASDPHCVPLDSDED